MSNSTNGENIVHTGFLINYSIVLTFRIGHNIAMLFLMMFSKLIMSLHYYWPIIQLFKPLKITVLR